MANRAYLYPHPSPAFERFGPGLPERYYDSRHTIPIGWFFLFRIRDVVLVDVQDWHEVKLAAPKAAALDLFRARRPLLDRYLLGTPLLDAATALVNDLDRWPGEYLLLDPAEVIGGTDGDDPHHKSQFESITESLDASQPERIDAALRPYVGPLSDDVDTRLCQVLGYTYPWE